MPKQTVKNAGGKLFKELMDSACGKQLECLPRPYDLCDYSTAFEDADLMDTCFALFENNLNVSGTARRLYMHRNTLIYRIAKLKRLTGLNVVDFSDAVTFLILYRCYSEGKGKQ